MKRKKKFKGEGKEKEEKQAVRLNGKRENILIIRNKARMGLGKFQCHYSVSVRNSSISSSIKCHNGNLLIIFVTIRTNYNVAFSCFPIQNSKNEWGAYPFRRQFDINLICIVCNKCACKD